MGEYAKAEPLIQEALRKALALVAPSVRRAGVGECLSLRSTLNRGPAADLPPSARAWSPCPDFCPDPPGSLLLRMTMLENRRAEGPRQQLAQANKTLLKLARNGNLFCLRQQYTPPVQSSLGCPRAPARSSKVNMRLRNLCELSSETEVFLTYCHLRQRNLGRGQSERGGVVI
jgi:hypothetical protein